MEVSPLSAPFGAKVTGIDLKSDIADDDVEALKRALLEHKLLLFQGEVLAPEKQIRFSARFGELESFPPHPAGPAEHPEIYPVSNVASRGFTEVGRYWHADGSFRPRPTVLSFFHMVEAAEDGGDTSYADMSAVLTRLPSEIRELARDLKTVHGNGTVHDLVRTHSQSRRPALFVNLGMIVGLTRPNGSPIGISPTKSREILQIIGDILDDPDVSYRHHWSSGDLIIADNQCVAHKAHAVDGSSSRLLHRTTTRGSDRLNRSYNLPETVKIDRG